jgi:hypothetical protein
MHGLACRPTHRRAKLPSPMLLPRKSSTAARLLRFLRLFPTALAICASSGETRLTAQNAVHAMAAQSSERGCKHTFDAAGPQLLHTASCGTHLHSGGHRVHTGWGHHDGQRAVREGQARGGRGSRLGRPVFYLKLLRKDMPYRPDQMLPGLKSPLPTTESDFESLRSFAKEFFVFPATSGEGRIKARAGRCECRSGHPAEWPCGPRKPCQADSAADHLHADTRALSMDGRGAGPTLPPIRHLKSPGKPGRSPRRASSAVKGPALSSSWLDGAPSGSLPPIGRGAVRPASRDTDAAPPSTEGDTGGGETLRPGPDIRGENSSATSLQQLLSDVAQRARQPIAQKFNR